MDADGAFDERHLRRTAKSCGSDAPTLASSRRKYFRWRRWQTSPVTGKSTKETVKTIARGMPGEIRCDRGDYARMLFYFACEAAGASRARHSLRPLFLRGEWIVHDSGASRRENAICCLKIGCDTFPCHHPRKRMIQYSTVTDDQSRRRSVLDTRLRGYDTERDEGAPHLSPLWGIVA